ncbi:hypothetical protein [Bacillus cereus]|uniref:hypothetical protein n=1 Tax=Bacillus cereus group TaxID=86661 RepID=UPI00240532B6|nr:hypothetical protein [Bacillus cereus]MDF9530584.1 hypothetical protein [Bacillus cereus]MDG1578858.1 hypothetical protein [Bacillus cereus]
MGFIFQYEKCGEDKKGFAINGTCRNCGSNSVVPLIVLPLCDICNGRIINGVSTSVGEHYCGSCYNKLLHEKRAK